MTEQLAQLLAEPGPWAFAYVDGPGQEPQGAEDDEPRGTEHGRLRSVRDRLEQAGASESDAEAVVDALTAGTGLASPSTHVVIARNGRVVVDESFASPRLASERVGVADLPEVLPLLRHRLADVRYLVVETGREGADVRLERAQRTAPEQAREVVGGDDGTINKVQAGGWSHARYHRHSEDVWMHNQSDVAEAVDQLVRDHRPAFVAISGDVRARQILQEQLAPASRELVVEVDAHTRAEGADTAALDAAIEAAVREHSSDAVESTRDRAASDSGSTGAYGVHDVVAALQQAQVSTLVLDARMLDSDDTLVALDAPPWVAERTDDALAANPVAEVSVAEGLARAALLSGARVLIDEPEPQPADAPRDDSEPRNPFAALRW